MWGRKTDVRYAILIGWSGLVAIIGTACGGGFYRIDNNIPKSNGSPPTGTGYITATIDLQNKTAFTSNAAYLKHRDSKLTHLYIYAEFPAGVSGPQKVPLYLVDFEKGVVDETRGAELISHYPYDEDARGKPLFRLQTRALKKNGADVALNVWSVTKGFAQNMAGMAFGPSTAPIFSALDQAANVLGSLAAKEQQYTAQIEIPSTKDAREQILLYPVIATDENNVAIPEVKEEAEKLRQSTTLAICAKPDDNAICVDGKPYTVLPYIIIKFTTQDYVSDVQLLNVGASCTGVDEPKVAAARARIAEAGVVSKAQHDIEESLDDRATALLSLRHAVAAGQPTKAIDAYDEYRSLPSVPNPNGALYKDHYSNQFSVIVSCVEAEAKKIVGFDSVNGLVGFMQKELDVTKLSEPSLESSLVEVASFVQVDDKLMPAVSAAKVYQRAAARILTINNLLYQKFYSASIRSFRAATVPTTELDAAALDLEHRYAATSCDKCRSESSAATVAYRSLKPASNATMRANLLAEASSVTSALKVVAAREKRVNGTDTTAVTSAVRDVDAAATESLQKDKVPLKKLIDKVKDARDVLDRHDLH